MKYKNIIGGDEKDAEKKFGWLRDAEFENAEIDITRDFLIWKGGTWINGVWKAGVWENGLFKGGTWEYGHWKNGRWEGGIWKDGFMWDNLRQDTFRVKFNKEKLRFEEFE